MQVLVARTRASKVGFNNGWSEYKYGFGNVSEDHWIGQHFLYF